VVTVEQEVQVDLAVVVARVALARPLTRTPRVMGVMAAQGDVAATEAVEVAVVVAPLWRSTA
jgi:hypothetical protein